MADSAQVDTTRPDPQDDKDNSSVPTTQFLLEPPTQPEVPRERWSYRWEFGFTAVALLADPSLLWRTPYLLYRYDGISFMTLYSFFMIIFALPMFYMEICLGQFCGKGLAHTWTFAPLFKGIGVGMAVVCAFMALIYNTILSWDVYYLFTSVTSSPWATCSNSWNTPQCTLPLNSGLQDSFSLGYPVSPETEYFDRKVLKLSFSIEDIGSLRLPLVGCLLFAVINVFFTLFWGVRVLGKVAAVYLILVVVLLVVLLIRSVTLDGSSEGLKYLVYLSSRGLANADLWFEALRSAFYSMAVSSGAIHTLASYKNFQSTIFRDSCFIVGTKILLVVVASIMVFGFFGFAANTLNVPVNEIAASGPSVIFQALPKALSYLPVSRAWTILLFFTMFLILMTSQFVHFEMMVTMVQDILPKKGHKVRALVTAAICGATFILTLPLLTQGGIYYFILLDWSIYTLAFPVFLLLECITVGWIYGLGQFSNDVKMMTGMRPPVIYKPIWCFLIPIVAVIILIVSLVQYSQPRFNDYQYPIGAAVVGWLISLLPLAPVAIFFLLALVTPRTPLVTPSPDWKPADPSFQATYDNQRKIHRSCATRLRDIFSS